MKLSYRKKPCRLVRFRAATHLAIIVIVCFQFACAQPYQRQIEDLSKRVKYYDIAEADVKYQGFDSVALGVCGIIDINVKEKSYAPEKEANEIAVKEISVVPPDLSESLAVLIRSVGDPSKNMRRALRSVSWNLATGWETTKVLSTYIDKEKSESTGRHGWVTTPFAGAQIEIFGLETPSIISAHTSSEGQAEINLSNELYNHHRNKGNNPVGLVLHCSNCTSNTREATLPVQENLLFTPPLSWDILALYQSSGDLVWTIDLCAIEGDPSSFRSGNDSPQTWSAIAAEVERREAALFDKRAQLPSNLVRDRDELLRNKPPENGLTLTRDEFEPTAKFMERVRATREAEALAIQAYNQKVDQLNARISAILQNARKPLTAIERNEIIHDALMYTLGAPHVKSVAYDADLEQFIVTVAGFSQPDSAPVQFTMVNVHRIPPSEARVLRDHLYSARPILRFAVSDRTVKPIDAHLVLKDRALSMIFIDHGKPFPLKIVKPPSALAQQNETLSRIDRMVERRP